MFPKQDLVWWYWLATIPFLMAGILGETNGLIIVALLASLQICHFLWREKSLSAFPVQVRLGYLAWFSTGLFPYLEWMLWIQLAGTSLAVLFDYCPMARLLALAPWNRNQPLSARLLVKTIFSRPVRGSILQAP
ncbi:hypothetical protein [Kaarinaea lacus]